MLSPTGTWYTSHDDLRAKLEQIIADLKARPLVVVLPAGTPGPDGRVFSFDIHDDAYGLIFCAAEAS